MADFSYLSDSSDEGAVEELIRQAMDLSVLEQVAAINCSSFTSDSVLPTHLETRFSRLKSVPAAKPNNTPSLSNGKNFASQSFNSHFASGKSLKPDHPISDEEDDDEALFSKEEKGLKKELGSGSGSSSNSSSRNANSSNLKENPNGKIRPEAKSRSVEGGAEPDPDDDEALFTGKGLKKNLGSGSGSSSFKSPNSSVKKKNKPNGKIGSISKSRSLKAGGPEHDPFPEDDEALFTKAGKGSKKKLGPGSGSSSLKLSKSSVLKETPNGKVRQKSKSRSGYISSPSDSSNSSMRSPSPPARTGCFWFSPKKVSRVKSKKNLDFGGDEAEFLSDLGIFSEKEQQKILKKAMKEEEKINREAEKIVKWAKQASARINVSDVEDELSDCDYPK